MLISLSDIVSINELWLVLEIMSVWRQTHYDVTEKNPTMSVLKISDTL